MEGTDAVAKAAQYAAGKAAEGTKTVARAVQGAAEYAGQKAVEIASKPIGAAKETVIATGESTNEYTAMKKEEAERELGAQRAQSQREHVYILLAIAIILFSVVSLNLIKTLCKISKDTERSYQGGDNKGEQESLTRKAEKVVEEFARPVSSTIQQTLSGSAEHQGGDSRGGQQSLTRKAEEIVGGVFAGQGKQEEGFTGQQGYKDRRRGGGGATAEVLSGIGETVVEIAQTTKGFMVGERSIGEKIVGNDDH